MNNVVIKSPWVIGNLSIRPKCVVQISIVAYEHEKGLPARFCAGLIPAAEVSKQLQAIGFESVVRVIDPTPIASYCNGWQKSTQFRNVIASFFGSKTPFFFDESEQLQNGALEVLREIGGELESPNDGKVADAVRRLKESGRRHGGDSGIRNSVLYMAAHPFSWLDMHHPLIWRKSYSSAGHQFVNLMSMAEERFTVVRKFLCSRRPDLCTNLNPIDRFMSVCNTPCYLPIAGEPLLSDLNDHGYEWCHAQYRRLAAEEGSYANALKDFEALMEFNSIRA